MIRAVGEITEEDGSQRPLLVIGLTPEDLEQLTSGKFTFFECESMDLPPMRVQVTFGESHQEILDELPGPSVDGTDGSMITPPPGQEWS